MYPYLASQVTQEYARTYGRVLELGPFSGGISWELAGSYPALAFTLADDNQKYIAHLKEETARRNLASRMAIVEAPMERLPFNDGSFDLVILRGAFFFIMDRPRILAEIYRVLSPGGMAFVGGGYGRDIPQRVIDKIADESRLLNDRLGRRRVTLEQLHSLIHQQGLAPATRLSEEGGVWLILRKRDILAAEKSTASLARALDLASSDVISLLGGGGKTSLMYRLACELSAAGKKVISTTTTRIIAPSAQESPCLIVEEDEESLFSKIKEGLARYGHVTAVRINSGEGKVLGLSPETLDKIAGMKLAHYIINEADGAGRKPIKAPRATEPVIPGSTTLVIALAGMEALGAAMSPETAFRTEFISRLTGLPEGGTITSEVIATLMTSARGIIQYTPPSARIVPFINKVELARDASAAREIAAAILARRHTAIKRVVAGSLQVERSEFRVFEPVLI